MSTSERLSEPANYRRPADLPMPDNRGKLTLPHHPNTRASIRSRCFPWMSLRHTGAVKEYLCLPLFAAAVAFLWAVNPSYIHQTVFDNSAVGAWFSLDLP